MLLKESNKNIDNYSIFEDIDFNYKKLYSGNNLYSFFDASLFVNIPNMIPFYLFFKVNKIWIVPNTKTYHPLIYDINEFFKTTSDNRIPNIIDAACGYTIIENDNTYIYKLYIFKDDKYWETHIPIKSPQPTTDIIWNYDGYDSLMVTLNASHPLYNDPNIPSANIIRTDNFVSLWTRLKNDVNDDTLNGMIVFRRDKGNKGPLDIVEGPRFTKQCTYGD